MQNTKVLYERGIIGNRKMITQSQFSQIQFSAVLNNFSMFYNVAKAINFVDHALVQLSNDGIKVAVEEARCFQASAYITKACFSEFRFAPTKRKLTMAAEPDDEQYTSFGLNLKVFTDCLSMFLGDNYDSSLKMLHKGEGAPLIVILEQHGEDDLITECSVKTIESVDMAEFEFEDAAVSCKLNIKAPEFFALLNEVDRTCEEVEVLLSPTSPFLKISTYGELHSETCYEITNASDMLVTFNCSEATCHRYKFQHFKLIMKTLSFATKISLRTNVEGLLGLQLMIENSDSSNIFVEYFILPLCDSNNDTTI